MDEIEYPIIAILVTASVVVAVRRRHDFGKTYVRVAVSAVVVMTSAYHLIFGEPWADELDYDYLVAINSREYTVPVTYAALAVAYAFGLPCKTVVDVGCCIVCPCRACSCCCCDAYGLVLGLLWIVVFVSILSAATKDIEDVVDFLGLTAGVFGIVVEFKNSEEVLF